MISRAYEEFQHCTQDESMRHLAMAREKFQQDVISRLNSAEQDGLEKGKELARLEDARKFKSLGVSTEIIVQATGLPSKIVENL